MNKSKYRTTKKWKDFRQHILEKNDYRCSICNIRKKKGMHIHHINEEAYGNETEEDVVPLCSRCHILLHQLERRKQIDIEKFAEQLKHIYYKTKKE